MTEICPNPGCNYRLTATVNGVVVFCPQCGYTALPGRPLSSRDLRIELQEAENVYGTMIIPRYAFLSQAEILARLSLWSNSRFARAYPEPIPDDFDDEILGRYFFSVRVEAGTVLLASASPRGHLSSQMRHDGTISPRYLAAGDIHSARIELRDPRNARIVSFSRYDHRTESWSKPERWACNLDIRVPRFIDTGGMDGYCAILRMLRFLTDAMQFETHVNMIAKYKEQIAVLNKALIRASKSAGLGNINH
nr:hypothetical protein [Candidatus Sigynarchaeum springense]